MSKFEEICQAFVAAKRTHFEERDACCATATHLAESFRNYLESPSYHLVFMPRSREGSSVKARTAKESVWYDHDGWHFMLGLSIVDAGDGPRHETGPELMVAELVLRKSEAGFDVSLNGWPDKFSVPADANPEACAPLFDFTAQRMIDVYRQPHMRFLEGGQESQRVLGRK
ncbi:MAG: hypothetical protein R6X13_11555 [bacterium]